MVGFNADRLLSVYSPDPVKTIFRPFQRGLYDQMTASRALEACRAHIVLGDEAYFSYLLLLEAAIEFSLSNQSGQQRQVQELLVELQGLLPTAEQNDISEELVDLTKQLLFKAAADYLVAGDSLDSFDLVPILASLSYQAVNCSTFAQPDVAAWSAYLALDSLTLLLHTFPRLSSGKRWNDANLGERIVTALIPKDGAIRRLHSDIFQSARQSAEYLLPAVSGELADVLAERLLANLEEERLLKLFVMALRRSEATPEEDRLDIFRFFRHFVKTLPMDDETGTAFTAIDFAVFLEWVGQWSTITQPNADLVAKISLTREQQNHWKSMITAIRGTSKLEDTLNITTIMRTVRLDREFRNLRLLSHIFEFLKENQFPTKWPTLYAKLIIRNLTDYVQNPRDHLFPLPAAIEGVTVDEENQIHQSVSRFLARQLIDVGQYEGAIALLEEFEQPAKRTLNEIYVAYKRWFEVAPDELKPVLVRKRELVKRTFEELYGETVSRPVTPMAESPAAVKETPMRQQLAETPKSGRHIPATPDFYSPSSTRECATSTEVSFLSAYSSPPLPERDELHIPPTPQLSIDQQTPIKPPPAPPSVVKIEPEEVEVEEKKKTEQEEEEEFMTEEEETAYFMAQVEQKLLLTKRLIASAKPREVEEVRQLSSTEQRYRAACDEVARLKRELDDEKRLTLLAGLATTSHTAFN